MGLLTFALTALSLFAAVLNIRTSVWCFYIWLAVDVAWAAIDYNAGLPWEAVLFAAYAAIAIYGIKEWRQK